MERTLSIPREIARRKDLTPGERIVYGHIWGWGEKGTYASLETIADETGYSSRSAVKKIINKLVEKELIEVKSQGKGKTQVHVALDSTPVGLDSCRKRTSEGLDSCGKRTRLPEETNSTPGGNESTPGGNELDSWRSPNELDELYNELNEVTYELELDNHEQLQRDLVIDRDVDAPLGDPRKFYKPWEDMTEEEKKEVIKENKNKDFAF